MKKLNFTLVVALFILVTRLNSYSVVGSKISRPSLWCDKAPGLSDGQRKLCRKVPGLQTAIKKGIEKGNSECEREFMWNRWNCTLLGEKSFFQRAPDNTREAAFTTALLSAALAYNVALACTEKDVIECSCEEVKRRPFREQSEWKWKGCSVNVGYGSNIAWRFMLSYRSNNTQSSIINKHNVRVGLEVLKENRVVKCTVGKRGNAKACRLTLPPLQKISRLIKSKYNKATKVVAIKRRNKQSFFLRTNERHTYRRNFNRPMQSELVFMSHSPSYCYRQDKYRIPGTRGRKCRRNTLKEDDCSLMCCGRGYNRNVLQKKRFCSCSNAAEVGQCRCKVCTDVVIENTCL